jgi:hypothetical protein
MGQAERHAIHSRNLHPATKVPQVAKVGGMVLRNTGKLGSGSMGTGNGHKQQESGKQSIPDTSNGFLRTTIKRFQAMAEAKGLMLFVDAVGGSVYLCALFAYIGDVRSIILFLLGVLYAVVRVIFMAVKNFQEAKLRQLDIREREIEVHELEDESKD